MNEHQNLMLAEAYEACQRIVEAGKKEGLEISANICASSGVLWAGGSSPIITFKNPIFADFLNRTTSELFVWEDGIITDIKERMREHKERRIAELEAELAKLKS